MALEKWHPLRELEGMRKEMDRIWDGLFPTHRSPFLEMPWLQPGAGKGAAVPPIDIIDNETEVIVKAEMPGVGKESVELSFHDGTLTIKGEIKEEKETKEENYYHTERRFRSELRPNKRSRRAGTKCSGLSSVLLTGKRTSIASWTRSTAATRR